MQRLFSTFPNSFPGGGLLLLRTAAFASALIDAGSVSAWFTQAVLVPEIALVAGVLVLVGLWTPYAGVVQVAATLWHAYKYAAMDANHILRAVICLSLAMTGPGAWSADARLFGRKLIFTSSDRE